MAQVIEAASEVVEKVHFGFMSDEEVRKHSVVKINNPSLVDNLERPLPGGLYDPALGPSDEQTPCKSCGKRRFHCPGHCGHIDLVSLVYNPLLFNKLYAILQNTCWFCQHFVATETEVERSASQLELIGKGKVIEAKGLDKLCMDCSEQKGGSKDEKEPMWTSLQFSEAMSVLNNFFKAKNSAKCHRCGAKRKKLIKPTFGWFHLGELNAKDAKANIIRGINPIPIDNGQVEENASSEAITTDEYSSGSGLDTMETSSFTMGLDEIDDSINANRITNANATTMNIVTQESSSSGSLLPSEVKDILKQLWRNEARLCGFICNIQKRQHISSGNMAGYSMFFLDAILVPPIKFRPASKGADSVMEHPHTVLLGKVLQSNISLGNAYANKTEHSRIVNRWMDLQQSINVLYDSKTSIGQNQKDVPVGICQLLEKKEGIFRQKMMGKRVNYACRSVISPDPYLAVNEIGIPPYFALRLTYPERVTPWNAHRLRDAIVNGPDTHPGSTHYSDKLSTVKLPPSRKMRVAISRKLPSSRGVVSQSGKSSDYEFEGKIVYRHLQDGDVVLVNRQPTLHKPSIMAHVVRVLKGEKTLRMHYANCSSYNADFDGDEMNVHLPQDEVSRAEAYALVNANNQYIVPTRGDTVRGLIQDHIVSAVLLTMKSTFLTLEEFNQLLCASGVLSIQPGSFYSNSSGKTRKVSIIDSEGMIHSVLPAMWKPKPLWTGKQVITAILNHLTKGSKPFTVQNSGKIPYTYFVSTSKEAGKEEDNGENKLLIWKNELVRGVIDKAQFGQYGLVHTVQELYGSNTAGVLLSALSRLFTVFLQFHGFTCGIDDLLILPHYEKLKKEELEGEDVGEEVHSRFVEFEPGQIGQKELLLEIEKAIHRNGQSAITSLDVRMKNRLRDKGSKINKELLLKGLLKLFPKNCISLMTISGAKGGTVNFQQISSSLGQQELEGKRVPRMVSGKTLPCFPPWDFASRAGGFITDCFLTGLRPQEYYFHCMAGREGLVDTAVKTSRSGYLQRCLIKNLESLKVSYDYTVRDADGSVVQFYYGEDGVDVHQTSFLCQFNALTTNKDVLCEKIHHDGEFGNYIEGLPKGLHEKMDRFAKHLSPKEKDDFHELVKWKYLSSLAHSGEPVGVIAGQSVGEPSTQMTLNTFHHAGRGEMNVTLGIPRLQEILTTASNDIKTPIMTCPLLKWKTKSDAKALVQNVKKISVADLIKSMEVHLLPISIHGNQVCRIYKLIVRLQEHELVSWNGCVDALELLYLRVLEDAIESHVKLLSRISGIQGFKPSQSKAFDETDEDASGTRAEKEDDVDDDDDDEGGEDLGSEVQKRKRQATDEMDYEEDDLDAEPTVEAASAEPEKETDEAEDLVQNEDDGETGGLSVDGEEAEMHFDHRSIENPKSSGRKSKKGTKFDRRLVLKKTDRAFFAKLEGLEFQVHFRFITEPHMLLGQIAQKAAKKVFVKSSGKVEQCRMVEYTVDENSVLWNENKKPKASVATKQKKKGTDTPASGSHQEDDATYWGLKTAGVDFQVFWKMEDELDTSYLYSNNIHSMLSTYGVEAARAALIMEIKNVFSNYGVKIDYRHLSLIADYMTHAGGYRPMSRHGCIAESISPFLKMSYETASNFIVEAASYGMTDKLETPSARICLGLPVEMGTGSFDIMQKLNI